MVEEYNLVTGEKLEQDTYKKSNVSLLAKSITKQ